MPNIINGLNTFFEQVPDNVRRYRLLLWILFIGLTIFLAFGLGKLKIEMSTESYFQDEEPIKQAYNQFRAMFGSDEVVYIVYRPKDGDVFSTKSLQAIKGIQDELLINRSHLKLPEFEPLTHITDVETIVNASYMETHEAALITRDFIGNNIPKTQAERDVIVQQAQAQLDYPLLYFSKDGQLGGMMVKTDFNALLEIESKSAENESGGGLDDEESVSFDEPAMVSSEDSQPIQEPAPRFQKTNMAEYSAFMKKIYTILHQPKYTDVLEFYPVGNPVLMAVSFKAMSEEAGMMFGGMLLFISLVLWLLFRSLSAVVWPLIVIVVSLVWVIGFCGWLAIPLSSMAEITTFLILAVGVADTVHILS